MQDERPPEPAETLPRLLALAFDLLWLTLTALPAASLLGGSEGSSPLAGYAIGVLALSLLVIPCWWAWGATPGQLLLGQQVVPAVQRRGRAGPRWSQAAGRWLVVVISLPLLGLSFWWQRFNRAHLALHDTASGTRVIEIDVVERRRSYARQHLGGELPLSISVLINLIALPLPLLALLGGMQALGQVQPGWLWIASVLQLLLWPLALLVIGWGLAGTLQSFRLRARHGPAALVLLLVALLGSGASLALAGVSFAPRALELASLAIGRDPLGTLNATLSPDGRRLRLAGPIAQGDAARVQALMAGAPNLQLINIESQSGRLPEALAMAAHVRERQLPTRASGECSGVCPLVFLAGQRRHLLAGSRLGFQRVSAGAWNGLYQPWVNRVLRGHLAAAGLSPHLVRKTLATPPPALWLAEHDELSAAGLVSVPDRPLDVELPGLNGVTRADYIEALGARPLWQALDRRFPGALNVAASHMFDASALGPAAVQAAGQVVVSQLMPPLLAQASPETRWLYTDILQAQVSALVQQDPESCRGLLLGDAAAHRQLPPALAWREAEWLLAALSEAPRTTPTRKPTAIESEVIRHALGPRAPAQLATLWRPLTAPPPGEMDCNRALALMSDMALLTAPLRRLALRLMYERE